MDERLTVVAVVKFKHDAAAALAALDIHLAGERAAEVICGVGDVVNEKLLALCRLLLRLTQLFERL